MSFAFQITRDDVANVLATAGQPQLQETAEEVLLTSDNADRIEKAALRADELDEQTGYAYEEMRDILEENRVLPPATL